MGDHPWSSFWPPRGRLGPEPSAEASEGTRNRDSPHPPKSSPWRLPAVTLEVPAPSSLHPPQGEMQKDTLAPPPSAPLASNTVQGAGRQASASGSSGKNETGRRASPKARRKPSISKVILGVVADRGMHNRVSLATLKKAVATMGYNMTRNAWRFKRVLKGLVDKGVLKQVTGKGASGSFRMGKKFASKFKLRAQRPRRSGQRRPGQRRLLVGSQRGHKRLRKEVRRVARCRRN